MKISAFGTYTGLVAKKNTNNFICIEQNKKSKIETWSLHFLTIDFGDFTFFSAKWEFPLRQQETCDVCVCYLVNVIYPRCLRDHDRSTFDLIVFRSTQKFSFFYHKEAEFCAKIAKMCAWWVVITSIQFSLQWHFFLLLFFHLNYCIRNFAQHSQIIINVC